MLFTISMWLLIFIVMAWVIISIAGVVVGSDTDDILFIPLISGLFCFMLGIIPAFMFFGTWGSHANDLARVHAQSEIVRVQAERADRLNARLSAFDYPSTALMNADTPVGAIVKELANAEAALAEAETVRAVAIRRIEARRMGPFSDVIDFVGDYK